VIPVERRREQEPSVLQQVFRDGTTELDRVTAEFATYLAEREVEAAEPGNESKKPKRFSFEYKRYREREVRQALEDMFHGKCAYCEQRYGALHPMDVEHWRPKGLAQYGDDHETNETGYWWLAADWDNLLPSCIDCNRGRKHQINVDTGERVLMGKANQFPLAKTGVPATGPDASLLHEQPLLLNPCDDGFDPIEHFAYDEGIIVGLTDQAKASIQVYALNRPELVHERQAIAKIFEHRLTVLADIAELVVDARATGEAGRLEPRRTLIEQMHDQVRDELFAMAEPARPFSGMIAFMIRGVAQELAAR